MNKFNRRKPRYYTSENSKKKYYRKLFLQTILCIIIVLTIIIIKLFNTDSTNKAIKIIKNNIENDRSIKTDTLYVIDKIKNGEMIKSVFKEEEKNSKTEEGYIFPVSGRVYRAYGEYKKSNDVQVFNKGVDIIASDETVKAITDGIVVEIGKDNIYGNFIVVKHNDYLAKYYGFNTIFKSINDEVKKGEIIGKLKVGNDKLNFRIEVYKDNEAVDPLEDLDYTNEDILLI